MARLIFICPYISGNGTRRSNHVNYIATREDVEMLAEKELNVSNDDNEDTAGNMLHLKKLRLMFSNTLSYFTTGSVCTQLWAI